MNKLLLLYQIHEGKQRIIQTANNQNEKISSYIQLNFHFEQIPNCEFNTIFYILEEMPVEANIGYEF